MKDSGKIAERVCPICGRFYRQPPALSRQDGRTEICPQCGAREALVALGCGPEEQEAILALIRASNGF